MRILHVTDRVSHRGGAWRHLLAVAQQQAREHVVHVAAGAIDDVGLPCPGSLHPALLSRDRAAADVDGVAAAFRPDVIHVHAVTNPSLLEWAADQGAVLTVQDHRYFCAGRGKWTGDGQECGTVLSRAACAGCVGDGSYFEQVHSLTEARLAAVRRMRAVVVLSGYMSSELVSAGVEPGRVAVVPPFVHGLDTKAEADGPDCVLFAGRLVEAKGVHDAVAAWGLAGTGLPLVFAGTGPLRAPLERAGHAVLGWVAPPRLSRVYRRARALLLPSRWQEPFGIVGLEALSLGVPVAAWRSGGVVDWHGPEQLVPWATAPRSRRACGGRSTSPQPPPSASSQRP